LEKTLQEILGNDARSDEILREWGASVALHPDMGYAVAGAPDYLGLPLHTARGSFLIVYWYDDDHVYCLGMRRVPSGIFGDDSEHVRR
jgi:hypothetical protein